MTVPGGAKTNVRPKAIAGLAAGLTVPEVAAQCGVAECTIRRWIRQPAFKTKLEAARAELVSLTVGKLANTATTAAATLRELLSPSNPPSVRLGAARAVLELGAKWRETEELARRIEVLEAQISNWKG